MRKLPCRQEFSRFASTREGSAGTRAAPLDFGPPKLQYFFLFRANYSL